MKTELNEITITLSPNPNSVGLSNDEFELIYKQFEERVNKGVYTVSGYCNLTFGRPTHIITRIERHSSDCGYTYYARIAFLEAHPETGHMAKSLLMSALEGRVKWQFAITQKPLEIISIEAITDDV